jgi:hypothetical protein
MSRGAAVFVVLASVLGRYDREQARRLRERLGVFSR